MATRRAALAGMATATTRGGRSRWVNRHWLGLPLSRVFPALCRWPLAGVGQTRNAVRSPCLLVPAVAQRPVFSWALLSLRAETSLFVCMHFSGEPASVDILVAGRMPVDGPAGLLTRAPRRCGAAAAATVVTTTTTASCRGDGCQAAAGRAWGGGERGGAPMVRIPGHVGWVATDRQRRQTQTLVARALYLPSTRERGFTLQTWRAASRWLEGDTVHREKEDE